MHDATASLAAPLQPGVCTPTERSPTTLHAPPRRFATVELLIVLGLLLFSGAINFVLLKCLFAEYGEAQAFFVSQGINVIYIVYGGLCLYPRLLPCGVGDNISAVLGLDPITPAMRRPHHQRSFLAMGALDCCGTFLTAMGAVFTPGQLQPLLNQSLIPATMLVSFLCLGTAYTRGQLVAAVLLVSGAALSVVPKLLPARFGLHDVCLIAFRYRVLIEVKKSPHRMSTWDHGAGVRRGAIEV